MRTTLGRMRTAMAVLILALTLPAAAGEIVEGSVWYDGPLPGCTVTLQSAKESRTTVTDAEGRYNIRYVPAGSYDLTVELVGFVGNSQRIDVNGHTIVPRVELRMSPVETVTLACSFSTCSEEGPVTIWDQPSCADERLHDALIENIERGDRSALVLLRERYEKADTYQERHRLAAALLGRVSNDKAIWNELMESARIAVRFPQARDGSFTPEFERYCEERNLDPSNVRNMSWNALNHAARDSRSHALLREALKTSDTDLIIIAIYSLADQRDGSFLPAIKDTLDRLAEASPWLVDGLAFFQMAEADEIAFRYLDEVERANYLEARNAATAPR